LNNLFKILLIEDDEVIRAEMKILLERNGYVVAALDDFECIVENALTIAPHLILLDLVLPYYDGYHICRELRKRTSIPIIVVTSRNTETDELISMHIGADDFVTKPYNTQILLARIDNILRRVYEKQEDSILRCGELLLNQNDSTAQYNGSAQELTKNEFRILRLLMKNQGKIVSRDQIMEELWQTEEFLDDNTLTVNMNRLRKKLGEIGASELIQTKRGQGYLI
jgi:DNA-binding response OmpR family regulator